MTAISSVVLVDKRIHEHETIVGAVKSDSVRCILFDVFEVDTYCQEQASTAFQYILNKIAELGVAGSFSNIGIVQHNNGAPFHRFFAKTQGEESTVAGVETTDPTLQTWAGFAAFITTLKTTYGVQNVDLMACALYSNPDWKYVIDTLAAQTGVTVRASTDDTGAAALGGDWFLESHTGVNLKDVYFTETIENFQGVLIYSTKFDSRSYFSTKSMAVGKATAWGSTYYGGGTDVNTITGGVITSGVVALYSTGNAFAALKTNGSVSTWGANGGNQTVGGTSPSVASSLTSGVVEIYTNENALAALKSDGTVITWGHINFGASSTSVDLTNVVDIFSGENAFAALKSNGSLVTWGGLLGNSSTAASGLTSGVVSVNTAVRVNEAAAAALKSDGSVVTWPTTSPIGGNSSTVTSSISSGVVVVYNDNHTFAALKNNGSVINWGNTTYSLDGNPYVAATSVTLSNIVTIHSHTTGAYAALNINGGVVTWGLNYTGGNSSGKSLSSNVVKVYNNKYAFAALKFDGSVVTWGGFSTDGAYGGNSTSVASELSSGVVAVYGNVYAFAALKSNGKVITWGHSTYGGSSSSVATDISAGIVGIYVSQNAFAALRNDGKLITWGQSTAGGSSSSVSTDLSAGVVSVNNTSLAFAAITSTATTFDLSMSYYRDIDRYNILRNKENRRRVNLTTLNNNVFTLSSTRDIQKFNYTIPSGNSFRIIVPDYVSSNYSIISTASIPGGASINYIIACDEGEPVTISGTTYINYGAFVYRRNADNTFTKMTSATIGGLTYKLYGGDGLFSSGIALQYRFGTFTVPAKAFGDASFNLTAPVTDSSGAFTYTSSDTTVATVTTGGTVTIIKAGTTTITATQAASGGFTSDSIAASLVVSKVDSTLGALTVPAKVTSDAPFTLTAPTSTVSSIISPVNTITSTASVIPTPPDSREISYAATWTQRGQDIDGEATSDQSGESISMSADGTVIAIGARFNNGTVENSQCGHVRIYAWNGSSWVQRGADIDGEAELNRSGTTVSLSANGTVVAIGAPFNSGNGTNAGHIRVYTWNGTLWVQRGQDIDGEAVQDRSGYSVSISSDGTVVAIGAIYNNGINGIYSGHVRIYAWNGISWDKRGQDIDGEATDDQSGWSVSMSADGTIVAIGAVSNDGTTGNVNDNRGHVRIYEWNGISWNKRGQDIDGEAAGNQSGYTVSMSADGTVVAIGAFYNDGTTGNVNDNRGHVRIYEWNGSLWVQRGQDIDGETTNDRSGHHVSISADGTIVAIGAYLNDGTVANSDIGHVRIYAWNGTSWVQRGQDIDGEAIGDYSGWSVSMSANGTVVAIGARYNDGTIANSNRGHVRVYEIPTTNAFTYSSSNSSVADMCGNLLLIKGVNGTSTITASQTGNTVTGRLDVSGTTYTLQYNPITYTIDSSSVASVSTYGTVTLTGTAGTSTITATQPETLNYASRSVTASLVVSKIDSTLGALTVPAKVISDAPFTLTAPTSTNSSIVSPVYTFMSSASVIPTPPDIRDISYGTTWIQRGADIEGEATGDYSGTSVCFSADGRTLAIGAPYNDGSVANSDRGHVRVYDLSGNTWVRRGADIDGEAANNYSGTSVSMSANGNVIAIGAHGNDSISGNNAGHVRIYAWNGTLWTQRGADIDGETALDESGFSVSLSADGNVVAIGAQYADLSGNTSDNRGHVRVYRYNAAKTTSQLTDQTLATYGPAGWDRIGSDIDGAVTGDRSGRSVSISADGTVVAIGGNGNDGLTGNDNNIRSHVRVYNWNGSSWIQRGENLDGSAGTSPTTTVTATATSEGIAWSTVSISPTGQYQTAVVSPGGIWRSSNFGLTWTAISAGVAPTNVEWTSVSISSTGQYQSAVYRAVSSSIYTSSDFGVYWTRRTTSTIADEFTSISISSTGQYQTAVDYGGNIWTSSNFGVNWTSRATVLNWISVSMSSTGKYQSAVVNSSTHIWTSSDFGVTWTGRNQPQNPNNSWFMITVSSTGEYQAAVPGAGESTKLFVSYDFGVTWTVQTVPNNMRFLAISSTGQYQTMLQYTSPRNTYTSSDFGVTWTARPNISTTASWTGLSLSSTGQYQTATTGSNAIRTSSDFGVTWSTLGSYQIADGDQTVASVSLSANGNSVAVGTPYADVSGILNRGRVRVFDWSGTVWAVRGTDIMIGEGTNDYSGMCVALSADSSVVAIGAPNNDGTPVLSDRGHARVYGWNGGAWVQRGQDIDGEAAGDYSGQAVSLSSDGSRVAIGAIANSNCGHVRVYDISVNNPITYSSSNSSVADMCGNLLLIKGVNGTSTITASQTGNTVTGRLDVSGTTYTLQYNPITYTIDSSSVATVSTYGTVTLTGVVGTSTITATQPETLNYASRSVTGTLNVSSASFLSNFSVPAKTYGDASFNLTDPETTDNTVGFTFASSNPAVATLSGDGGRTVTIVGAGSSVITASQAATANRGQLDISATLVVSQATPVITAAAITKSYGNASFRPVITSTNTDTIGGLVFTFTSDNIAVVSMLDASLVRINGIGTATLSITQAASANFTDASSSVVVTVNKGVSGFSASTFAVEANKTFGDAAFAITTAPISSSTGAITYTSSDESVAVITSNGSGNAITVVGQGTVTFTASQAESALYAADTKTSNTLTVARKTAALSRDTPAADTISKAYGNANFFVIATNESNGAFSFTSSDSSIATIDASTGEVTIVAIGSTTLTATRAQTAQYNASSVSWTLNIARGTTTLTGLSSLSRSVALAPFTVSATSASDGAVSYALQDPSSTILTIHPTTGRVRLKSPGSAVIVVSQAQGTLYDAPTSITTTITVNEAGVTLQNSTVTDSYSLDDVNLNGAFLDNATITNTNFSSSNLGNSNFNNSNVTNANMSNANLSDSTMRNATMNGVNFTSAGLQRTDLSGANVRNSIFNNADLSGAILTRIDASGASFINANLRGANLSNADFTNANMTNADIDGADITNVTFTIPQKLQLLKNQSNRTRSEIQVSQTTGNNILAVVSAGSAVRDVPNIANATFKVISPTTTTFVSGMNIIDIILDTDNYTYFYFTIKDDEYFRIQGIIYRIDTTSTPLYVRNYATGAAVENTTYGIKAIRLLAGSLTIIVNSQNTLSTSSFVVPSIKQNTDAPFSPTTLPTSNSSAPIVYTSSNTNIATIDPSTGLITPVAGASGYVRFIASQVATDTHESASIMSNELFVNQQIDFTLVGLNQTLNLTTVASLDASSISMDATDATAVFYVRLSDMTNLFQYQTDAFDVNNIDASDIKYYVFHRTMPTELHINPSHAMMNKTESTGMLGTGIQEIGADKSLVKHDFVRYIALRLFNTHYGVDLFQNEQELHENITYLGETVQHNIDTILSNISTTSASQDMAYDASGNKYLTNDASGNTNLCRELMRQLAAAEPSRFYNNGADTATYGIRTMPLRENDSINFKLTITAAESQNIVTGVTVIPSRTYLIKMILKNTVSASTNANTVVTDSEMYPNSYPYSTSVVTYTPSGESSASVYNVYSPPAPIPTARYGYNGWYYANSTTWVNGAQAVRDRVKWVLPPNAAGSSTVADIRYIRMNLKVFNTSSLAFLVVSTQAGSTRKYTISAPNSLTNGTVYSFYMNFNSYTREPATVGATNAAMAYSNVGSGSFANGEVITSIAVETDSAAASGSVEFTLSSVVIGEASGEKEYGFSANV